MDAYKKYIEVCRWHFEFFSQAYHLLIFYPRKKGVKRGCIIATEINDKIYIGWSLCNLSKDKFNKYIALSHALKKLQQVDQIAIQDMYHINYLMKQNPHLNLTGFYVPHSLQKDVEKMYYRAISYFKKEKGGNVFEDDQACVSVV